MHGPDEVGVRGRAVCRGRGSAGAGQKHARRWASWMRSGAPASISRSASAPRADRVVFINTGFLDRTGDEIHTSMEAAAVCRKSDLKKAVWLDAYERAQRRHWACVRPAAARRKSARACGPCRISWPTCSKHKIAHPLAGANTAWVPSPTAATLHALHYHQVNVAEVQAQLAGRSARLCSTTS